MKICSCCKIQKDFSDFYPRKDKNGKITSYRYYCIKCNNEKKAKYRKDNLHKVKEYNKKYKQENGSWEAECNRDPLKREKYNAWKRKWRKSSPKAKMLSKRDELRRRGKQKVPESLILEIEARDKGVCCFCFKLGNTIEHLTPVTRGGDNNYNNLITLCQSCNSSKNNQTFLEWLYEQATGIRYFMLK